MIWTEPGLSSLFALLPLQAQWDLHDYYQPDQELDEAAFNQSRAELDRSRPYLIHQAGKHFRVLESTFVKLSRDYGVDPEQMSRAINYATHQQARSRDPHSKVTLSFVAKPLNPRKLARVFIQLALHQARDRIEASDINPHGVAKL
jgi:hypothetical protein